MKINPYWPTRTGKNLTLTEEMEEAKESECDEVPNAQYYKSADENLQLSGKSRGPAELTKSCGG